MRISVKVKTKAKEEGVERIDQPVLNFGDQRPQLAVYKVSVKEAPVNGKANEAVIKLLAKYFDTTISSVVLVSGQSSPQKIFEIE